MKQKSYREILDSIASDSLKERANLWPQIAAQLERKSIMTTLRTRPLMAIVLVLFTLLALTGAAYAIGISLGYVPGLGVVDQNVPLRELAEPVSITQDGFTLRVDKAILSSEKTMVMYSLDGITADMQSSSPGCDGENFAPVMRLPGGSKLELELRGSFNSNSQSEVIFAPMPADVNDATLIINCINYASPEQVPQYWEVPLQFVTASPALTIAPVLDASATNESSLTNTAPQDGLMLNNVVPFQDGYIFSGTIKVTPPTGYKAEINYGDDFLEDITITDANGQALSVSEAPADFTNSMLQSAPPENANYWDCQVHGKNIQWPLTITIHSLRARGPLLPQAEFQINVGSDPKADQVWKLNQDVSLGAKIGRIVSVRRVDGGDYGGLPGYEFTLTYDPTLDFWPEIKGYQPMGGGGRLNDDGTYIRTLLYRDTVPTGTLTVIVNGYELIQLPGPWQVTWQP